MIAKVLAIILFFTAVTYAETTSTVEAIVSVKYTNATNMADFLNARAIGSPDDDFDVRLSTWAHELVSKELAAEQLKYLVGKETELTDAFKASLTNVLALPITIGD